MIIAALAIAALAVFGGGEYLIMKHGARWAEEAER